MRKIRVLIVEDEIIIVRGLEEALERLRYSVSGFAPSAEEALDIVREKKPDLALVDVFLRGKMDGIELARIFTSRFGIPVIYITAYSNREVLERAKLGDPFGYLVKPVRESQLKVSLELAVQRLMAEKKKKAVAASHLKTIAKLQDEIKRRTDELQTASRKLEKMEQNLERQESKLDELRRELLDLNGALLALTKRMERTREEVEIEVARAIRSRILPILRELESDPSFEKCRTELDMLFLHMSQLSSSLSKDNPWCTALSTTELRIATLIKKDLTSEVIARQLHLSLDTVKTHRRNIRRKLNIRNTDTNLTTYLKAN